MSHTTGTSRSVPRKMYLVSYDISDNRCRNKIAKKLEGYGKRVQYSVFECIVPNTLYEHMVEDLTALMEMETEGNIRIYPICENCRKKQTMIGIPDEDPAWEEKDLIIV